MTPERLREIAEELWATAWLYATQNERRNLLLVKAELDTPLVWVPATIINTVIETPATASTVPGRGNHY